VDILGVRIDNYSKKEILEKIESFLAEEKFHHIATVNPEFVLKSQKDLEFMNILNKTQLNVADGVGIWYASLMQASSIENRIAGIDLMQDILQIADKKGLDLFLAIHHKGLSSFADIKKVLNVKYPNIRIFGRDIDPRKSKKMEAEIDHTLVFCNFGFPQQEKFINSLRSKQDLRLQLSGSRGKIRLAMGVGGSFDFVTGKILRAPLWMQKIGLEWLWRFVQEPRYRFKRIINAVIVFPFLTVKKQIWKRI
jgi:N-acetylglucosaminyldiphosphoundecaprenol N-acetyl-beta-D-mannosaminyltransferase